MAAPGSVDMEALQMMMQEFNTKLDKQIESLNDNLKKQNNKLDKQNKKLDKQTESLYHKICEL